MKKKPFPAFTRYIGIDYSGAGTADDSLKGLRVFVAATHAPAVEVMPPAGPRRYWSRRGLTRWLAARLDEGIPTMVGIDHGFSFPLRYFEKHRLEPDWDAFLVDFQHHWPTDRADISVDFIRHGRCGSGKKRKGDARWRRICEERCGAKSVFHFDVPGQVAKSTHAGLPWLLYLRQKFKGQVHFWPYDGWIIPPQRSALAEAYPRLWHHLFQGNKRTSDQHDAFAIAAWLQQADREGRLQAKLEPDLTPAECAIAKIEGWILGVE